MKASPRDFDHSDAPPAGGPTDAMLGMYRRFAWGLLLFNFLIIALGALVRASGSGDGCGSHWPLCDGEVIPSSPSVQRVIEYTHRLFSGIDGPLVLALLAGAFYLYPRKHPIRAAAIATFVFTGVEAWIGAYLVKQRLVATNATPERAVWMALHLTNTFLLLTAIALAVWFAHSRRELRSDQNGAIGSRLRAAGQGTAGGALVLGFVAMIALGASGAVTALGDTLFPVASHNEAVRDSLAPGAHFLVKLRLLHPYIAGSVGLYTILIAGLMAHLRPSPVTKRAAQGVALVFLMQVGVGLLNVFLKAPIWMQIIHLLMADIVWVAYTFLALGAIADGVRQVELAPIPVWANGAPTGEMEPDAPFLGRPTWRDYVLLTKPRVISLLLFTTLAAMFIAGGGWPHGGAFGHGLLIAVALGGYMSAGAANAINMVIDRDIDGRMKRTATRPTVTQKISSRSALFFGFALAFGSFTLLWVASNLLTAMLSLAGLVFYVIVYTLLLKRRTWHNIVIGGAAGAFPPLVGWAAVTGGLSPLAWYLFAIIFAWTPAHFWALSLLIKDEYAEVGVPMLPCVLGERVTVLQIGLYSILTAVVSLMPLAQGLVGWYYVAVAALLNVVWLAYAGSLYVQINHARARSMFLYSMLYLLLLFLAMAFDSASVGWQGTLVAVVIAGVWYALRRARKTAPISGPPAPIGL